MPLRGAGGNNAGFPSASLTRPPSPLAGDGESRRTALWDVSRVAQLIPDLFFQLKMILIKCCDISNEVRPVEVAEPWVDCLLEEYFMQVGASLSVTPPGLVSPLTGFLLEA